MMQISTFIPNREVNITPIKGIFIVKHLFRDPVLSGSFRSLNNVNSMRPTINCPIDMIKNKINASALIKKGSYI